MSQPLHRQLGLTDAENDRIPQLIGRAPTGPELMMFSLMWSEHCSYKHSKPLLRRFPTTGPLVVQGPGENAGAIDVGQGWAVALKVESHNHPSAVEPFEGAATGVGGIVRDILALGAKPIALLDSLRFGSLDSARSRHLFARAVEGIGHYGNCIGVPTVGGEVSFDDRYEDSCLVNAMCVGMVRTDGMLKAAARVPGNHLVLIGNRTGRDGIGGASVLASAELSHDDADKRPSVQVSDPFTERKLMDCCLQLADEGMFTALQDLGAAGLTSAASEMAAKGGLGLLIDLDLIPLREEGMPAAEILVSESQERMLAEVTPANLARVLEVCARWELEATAIGTVTDTGNFTARFGGEVVVDIPASALTDDAPVYQVPIDPAPPATPLDLADVPAPPDLAAAWLELLRRPSLASKRWIYERYDHLVGANTVRRPGGDAAVVRLPGMTSAIAVTTDCQERHCEVDPLHGGMATVLEAARNLACTGARPAAASDCLNFGNPEKGATGWRLQQVIEGMSQALERLGVPVVSGNVSLYNESPGRVIYPTPVVGMVGLIDDAAMSVGQAFQEAGDVVVLMGSGTPRLDAGAWLGRADGCPPVPDPDAEARLVDLLVAAAGAGLLRSAHDVSDGGIAVTLAESAMPLGVGCEVTLPVGRRPDEDLFGEGGGRVVASVRPQDVDALRALAGDVAIAVVGTTGGRTITVKLGEAGAELHVEQARQAYENALPEAIA
ncbi:MAG: phosphoribosylformylglycinamidine synthase subunit PurL [Thermoleophilia bacterium]